MADAAAKVAEHAADLAAEQKANIAEIANLSKKQEEEQAKATKAAEEAHKMAIAARQAQIEKQEAEHTAMLNKRKEDMSSQYKHVWFSGETGVVMGQVSVYGRLDADELVKRLFQDNMIADSWYTKNKGMSKTVIVDGEMSTDEGERKLVFVTSELRAPALAARIEEVLNGRVQDLVFWKTKTGNKNYISFVKDHTQAPDETQNKVAMSPQNIIDEQEERDPLTPS